MARPTTKKDLLDVSDERFSQLWKEIDSLTEEEQQADFDFTEAFLQKKKEAHWTRDKNLRDILIHLYEWHELLLQWVEKNQKGELSPFLPAPYNWRTYGQMNIEFVKKHQNTSLEEAKKLLIDSQQKVMKMIESYSNDELFSKGKLSWVGNGTLGSYCVSATSSHYDWAIKKIKQYAKSTR